MNNHNLNKLVLYLISSKFLVYSGLSSITTAYVLNTFKNDNKYTEFFKFIWFIYNVLLF